ncbi:hypothetical protein [Holdemanella sp.]|uniref:hypothetical protein n=1 Tax=Holdemanella sp. TaxID=1971762 RepID=UPI0025854142|nr:hypothetical protein [Holdemanella sp.]
MELKYNDIYLKGKEEENKRWIIKIISYGLKQNLSLDEIASIADISVEKVEQYINENCLN